MPARQRPDDWSDIAAELGERVRRAREERQLTQEQLAELTGISRNQIQNIEHSRNNDRDESGRRIGGTANPRLDTIWALSTALEIEIGELLSRRRN